MSDQEFETFREFVILDFFSSLETPILQKFPDHLYWEGGLLEQEQESI